ncbi:transposable element Tcb1 transposase [Trichonephila clavipes]|nr:transposable element Tcb1 transposase [Trichonephila clavipes]
MINGRTRLHVVANGTMTGQRYIEVLLPHVRLFRCAGGDKFVFMDDNATCHRTLTVQVCLDSKGIQRLVWPARSPDLNHIENVWDALGRQVAGRNYPPTNKNTLIRALTEEWDKLPQQLLDNVVQNAPSIEKVIIIPTRDETLSKGISHIRNSCYLSDFLESGKELDGSIHDLIFEQLPFDHPLFLICTSGTTGLPKAPVHGCGRAFVIVNQSCFTGVTLFANLYLYEDGSTPHIVHQVKALLSANFGDNHDYPDAWPSRSPNFNPWDFWLWRFLKDRVCRGGIWTLPDLKASIIHHVAEVPRELLSDEAHFCLNGYVNKQNYRIWSEANPQMYVETPLHPEKLTVWCALWAGGILLQKR